MTSLPSGGPQRGGAAVLPGGLSLEGAPVLPGAGAEGGDPHQVRPVSRPEWKLEGSVRPRRTQHLPEQVPLPAQLAVCFLGSAVKDDWGHFDHFAPNGP